MKALEFLKKICYNVFGEIYKEKGEFEMNAVSLSNYVISLFEEQKSPVTNLKLQKVLYYIQGYFYRRFNKEAFAEEIYNWQYGPVVPVVYYEYNNNGYYPLSSRSPVEGHSLSDCEKSLIKAIVEKCAAIHTSVLVSMTHSENPWKYSNLGCAISKKNIELYFKYNDPLGIIV